MASVVVFLLACSGKPYGPADTADAGPCADGGWGFVEDPYGAVHVRADGSDDGDGTVDAPLATVEAGLELSRSGGARTLAIGPGTWEANLELSGAAQGGADDGLAVAGCGIDETILESAASDAAVVRAVGVDGLEVAGLSMVGGYRGLVAWTGSVVEVTSVSVRDSERVGIVWDGSETFGTMVDVEVHDPQEVTTDDGDVMAYGVAIQGATVTMTGGGVWGATRVGVLVDEYPASATFTDVTVADTLADDDDYWGRGIQIQEHAQASLAGGLLSGNRDAGLFALRASILDIQGLTVEDTETSRVASGTDEPGDGIVIAQADGVSYGEPVYFVTLTDNEVSGSGRAGILVDGSGISAAADGNLISGSAFDPSGSNAVLYQGGAQLTGSDGTFDLDAAAATLAYESALLASDDLNE